MESTFPIQKEIALLHNLYLLDPDKQDAIRQSEVTIRNDSICTCVAYGFVLLTHTCDVYTSRQHGAPHNFVLLRISVCNECMSTSVIVSL